MILYRYKALGKEGVLHKGMMDAPNSSELKARLREIGLSPITYSRGLPFFFSRKVKPQVLMDLCFHLEQFENAGIPLKESLVALCQNQSTPNLKLILKEVIRNVEGGVLFSKALERHPFVFDSVFIGLIAAGEKTGNLSHALGQIFQHLKWADEVQAQTFKALRYPLIMASVLFIVIYILMTTLVPELVQFIKNFSGELPLSTQLLIGVSDFLSHSIFFILALCGILLILFRFHPKMCLWKDLFLDRLPLMGPLRRQINLVRFCHVFAVLFESGIDILQALQTARKSLKCPQMLRALENAERFIREGLSLSEAFQKVVFFPPLVVHMVKIGEQTGSLQKTLFHVKQFLDQSLKRQVDYMTGLIEPLMILSVGLIMGWIIYSVFLPLYDTLSILGN